MYVTTGMSGYRKRGLRGLGDVGPYGPLPGEGDTPIGPYNESGLPAAAPFTLTSWLNANSTMVAVGAAAAVGLLLIVKAGR